MIDQADLDEIYRRYSTLALREEAREKLRQRTRREANGHLFIAQPNIPLHQD